jgi:hypothetical protein
MAGPVSIDDEVEEGRRLIQSTKIYNVTFWWRKHYSLTEANIWFSIGWLEYTSLAYEDQEFPYLFWTLEVNQLNEITAGSGDTMGCLMPDLTPVSSFRLIFDWSFSEVGNLQNILSWEWTSIASMAESNFLWNDVITYWKFIKKNAINKGNYAFHQRFTLLGCFFLNQRPSVW